MSDCIASRALDYISKLKRTDPRAWFWIMTGRLPADDAELQHALANLK